MNLEIESILEACETAPTRRVYRFQLERFAEWLSGDVDYGSVTAYRAHLQNAGKTPQNINQALSAIRFWATAALQRGWITPEQKAGVYNVKNLKIRGRKLGQWLPVGEAQALINKPPLTPIGQRDRAILALLIGAGLRRSEVCQLQLKHFEQREVGDAKRWLLIGIQGKHGRTRNIPIADWVKSIVDKWLDAARIRSGFIFRRILIEAPIKLADNALTPQSVYLAVKRYGYNIGRGQIAPHDLRRTFARLAFEGNAPIAQIQLTLGHASQVTTEAYVNAEQDIQIAPGDVLGIEVEA